MQTNFTPTALADPRLAASEKILRTCVHCGFCTATCPTYVLLGDELDSPRGRIYLIKDMLEGGKSATPEVVRHVDRCLSCLSCMTTCPSGVNYMHLVDHARAHVENTYRRPFADRVLRATLAKILPYPNRFRLALAAALLGKPFAKLLGAIPGVGARVSAMLALAPREFPARPAPEPAPDVAARLLAGELVDDLRLDQGGVHVENDQALGPTKEPLGLKCNVHPFPAGDRQEIGLDHRLLQLTVRGNQDLHASKRALTQSFDEIDID